MNTPIVDFVKNYAESDFSRLHMPGHKGKNFLGCESLDITEIKGADALYEADGIISESEKNATELFSSGRTLFSTEGSSHGIRSMIYLALKMRENKEEEPVILAARNAHKAFLYALALTGCDVSWLYPKETNLNSVCACKIDAEDVRKAYDEAVKKPFALYLTTPDYLGQLSDIKSISEVCRKKGMLLLIDNAHGAYLHFLKEPCHPMDLGADICCDSAHKTLPVLTGGAYLHLSKRANEKVGQYAKSSMALFGSTSPSYLIMQSLDLCNKYLSENYRERLFETCEKIASLKKKLEENNIPVLESEKLKVVIDAPKMGYTGYELQEALRKNKAEAEFADETFLVCMLTPENRDVDYERLFKTLAEMEKREPLAVEPIFLRKLKKGMGIREAVFAPCEIVGVEASVGRICASPTVSCPPAVPIAISGDIISSEVVPLFKSYGVEDIAVVK